MKYKTLVVTAFAIASLHGQENPADPYREAKAVAAAPTPSGAGEPKNISICYETFSLPLAVAAKIQREQLSDSDLYARIAAAVEKQAARQETFTVLRARSGQRATTESISEQIYPTEYEPPELPNSVGVSIVPPPVKDVPTPVPDTEKLKDAPDLGSLEGIKTPATPTAFETRNTGVTFEIEPTLAETEKILDLRIAPGHVALVGHTTSGQGLSLIEMPVFENQSVNTSVTLHINQPFLVGTINRPPNSKMDPDSANRVWFAFVTGTLAKP